MAPIPQNYPYLTCLLYNCRQKDLESVLNLNLNLFLSKKFAKLTFPNLSEINKNVVSKICQNLSGIST